MVLVSRQYVGGERRSMRMVWKTLRLRHLGLAFFWACSMLTFRSSILLSGSANTLNNETLLLLISFLTNMTTLLAISALIERTPDAYKRLPSSVFCACIMVGLVALVAAGWFFNGFTLVTVLVIGSVLCGVGYGFFWGSWAEFLGRIHPSRTSFYVPAIFLLTAVLFLVVSLAVEQLHVPVLVLMLPLPIVSLGCLKRCFSEVPDGHYAANLDSKRYFKAIGSLISLIVASLVLSLLFGFVWEITVLSVGSVNKAHQVPLIANVVVALGLIILVLFAHKRLDLALVYRYLIPVIVVLFAILPFFWERNPIALNLIMSATYGAFDVIIWYMVTSIAYDFAVSGFVVGGLVRALSILARLTGLGAGYLSTLIAGGGSILVVTISVGALYALIMLGLFYATRRRRAGNRASAMRSASASAESTGAEGLAGVTSTKGVESHADTVAPRRAADVVGVESHADAAAATWNAVGAEGRVDSADMGANSQASVSPTPPPSLNITQESTPDQNDIFAVIAQDFSLTRREAEVLPYLARGRSAKVIAEALFVSENTIRSHTRRILEKTELHSKQDLIDLIEKYR